MHWQMCSHFPIHQRQIELLYLVCEKIHSVVHTASEIMHSFNAMGQFDQLQQRGCRLEEYP